jgi:hypothetical protein
LKDVEQRGDAGVRRGAGCPAACEGP